MFVSQLGNQLDTKSTKKQSLPFIYHKMITVDIFICCSAHQRRKSLETISNHPHNKKEPDTTEKLAVLHQAKRIRKSKLVCVVCA